MSIASCDLLAAIFVMLKILRLLFVGRIELFNNNGRLAPVKTKTTTRGMQSIMANTGPLTMRKSTQGFPFLSYMGIELCLYLYSYMDIWGSVGIINCSAWQPFGLQTQAEI